MAIAQNIKKSLTTTSERLMVANILDIVFLASTRFRKHFDIM